MSKKNILVDEFTSPSPITVVKEESLETVVSIMKEHKFRHIPVVNSEGAPVGLISDRDVSLLSCFDFVNTLKASDVMVPEPFVAQEGDNLEDVVFSMSSQKIGSAVILDIDQKVSGIFTSTDALNALVEILRGVE